MERFASQRIYLDTNCFIYLFEDHPIFGERVYHLFTAIEQGSFRAITSVLTLMEVMAGPLKLGENQLAGEYASLMTTFPGLTLHDMDRNIATKAATFRAMGIRAPDAIHLATSVQRNANFFITADQRLTRVKHMKVVTLQTL